MNGEVIIKNDAFIEALFSEKTDKIPDEYDWFSPLIGDWDFDYYDNFCEKDKSRHVKGEWEFRRIIEGAGIEDLFICPSRQTRFTNPQPDGEYGVALRMFNPEEKCYDMVYTCDKYMTRLKFAYEDGKLVGTVLNKPKEKWVFSEISENTFHWQNVTVLSDGTWQINCNIYAKRKG